MLRIATRMGLAFLLVRPAISEQTNATKISCTITLELTP